MNKNLKTFLTFHYVGCGNYLTKESIQGRILFKETRQFVLSIRKISYIIFGIFLNPSIFETFYFLKVSLILVGSCTIRSNSVKKLFIYLDQKGSNPAETRVMVLDRKTAHPFLYQYIISQLNGIKIFRFARISHIIILFFCKISFAGS